MRSIVGFERITRGDGRRYLDRWILFRCRWFGLYLHRFWASDDTCPHDHPWPFVSVILRRGYWEWTPVRNGGDPAEQQRRWYRAGSVLFRPAAWRHRIELEPGRPAWSLVFVGRRQRLWGFWTAGGFVPWRRYRWAKHCAEE